MLKILMLRLNFPKMERFQLQFFGIFGQHFSDKFFSTAQKPRRQGNPLLSRATTPLVYLTLTLTRQISASWAGTHTASAK